jgi:hypothetical protein
MAGRIQKFRSDYARSPVNADNACSVVAIGTTGSTDVGTVIEIVHRIT